MQVSWLGFLASTGVPGMDFMLADPISAPAGHQLHFTEAIHHLPDTVNCFTPPTATDRLTPGPLPARERGHITFGSFQNLAKLTPEVLTLWAEILRRLPDARLRLQNKQMSHEASRLDVLSRLGAVGVTPDRVDLQGAVPDRQDYLAHHAEVDIILDTFPYPGITTTCEALWMGVPTLTLAGDRLLSRQGASLMHCAGLPDWVATDAHDYADRAVSHANDLDGLERLRRALRAQVLASPIFDAPRFASHLESALHALWRQVRSPGP